VREQARGTLAVYWDADCAFPEVETLLAETPHCLKYPASEPFLETLARFGPHAGAELERATMRSTVTEPVKAFLSETGYNGAAYGLRAEESHGRHMNRITRGHVFYTKQFQIWMCQPICAWSYSDVWAYIVSNELPYCGTYDRMWTLPEREQRISYWAGETNRQQGRWLWLKRNYPALWQKLRSRVPEASSYA
jgi:3'-phosphoadenosine 5'-phosphosulfate sulfotransferase (PAPS reductase)/FAD synthetase